MKTSLETALQHKASIEAELLKIPGVTAVDVGYKYVNGKRTDEIAIRVHVAKKKKTVSQAEMIPAEVNGIKTDVIEGTYEAQLVSKKRAEVIEAQADTMRYRPLQGGISIGPDRSVAGSIYAGTLGCMVKDNTNSQTVMLSNFHVMCIDNTWHAGDAMDQPSLIDTGTHADGVGALVRAVLSTHVDGAISSINSGVAGQTSVAGIGDVAGTAAAVLGSAVRKRGRTTLLTYGTVDGLNGTVTVNYGAGLGSRTLTDQIFINSDTTHNPLFSDHGDSGSVIMDSSNHVVGLLFAGSGARTIANPIAFVEAELNVKVLAHTLKPILKERIKEKIEKLESKEHKVEIKEHKLEKAEMKEGKLEVKEKIEIKEHKEFKEIEKNLKEIEKIRDKPFDNPGGPIQPPGGAPRESTSSLEERVVQLESTLQGLTAFIDANLRPDLTNGALTNE